MFLPLRPTTTLMAAALSFLGCIHCNSAFTCIPQPITRNTQRCRPHDVRSQEYNGSDDDDDRTSRTALYYNSPSSDGQQGGGSKSSDSFDVKGLNERLIQMRVNMLEAELQRPPNPKLTSTEFVRAVLEGLWNNGDPMPDSGFRLLLRCATPQWKHKLYDSVGAPPTANPEVVASALGDAIGRPNNQFGILVRANENDNDIDNEIDDDDDESPPYLITFPSDPVDYADGTGWVEVQLRGKTDYALWVVMGWQLQQRTSDNAWLVDSIDWQDFRDKFRPGIGREEWMRVCG